MSCTLVSLYYSMFCLASSFACDLCSMKIYRLGKCYFLRVRMLSVCRPFRRGYQRAIPKKRFRFIFDEPAFILFAARVSHFITVYRLRYVPPTPLACVYLFQPFTFFFFKVIKYTLKRSGVVLFDRRPGQLYEGIHPFVRGKKKNRHFFSLPRIPHPSRPNI